MWVPVQGTNIRGFFLIPPVLLCWHYSFHKQLDLFGGNLFKPPVYFVSVDFAKLKIHAISHR